MPHICPFCQRELPALGELSHYCLTLPPSPTRQGVEPDEKVADEQPAGHLSRLILPPHSALPPSVLRIEGIVAWLTEGRGKVVNVKIVCDQCGRGYSYARAEVVTTRRKCSQCAQFYDMCDACMGTAECCPWCGEVDLWW